jgi:hypothetical protein
MELVEDHRLQTLEEAAGILRGQQQRNLFRRCEQDVGRVELLPLPLEYRRVAGAGLQPDRQTHLGDRRLEVAMDVDGERLQGRDVERMRSDHRFAGPRRWLRAAPGKIDEARQEAGERLPSASRRNQQHGPSGLRLREELDLMRSRRPALLREPRAESRREKRLRVSPLHQRSHWNKARTAGRRSPIIAASVAGRTFEITDRSCVELSSRIVIALSYAK